MNDHRTNIVGAFVSVFFAALSKAAAAFERHAAAWAAFAAVLASLFTIANIIRGWLRQRRNKPPRPNRSLHNHP